MRKGVQCYTIRDHLNDRAQIIDSFKKIKNIGYDCLQLGGLPITVQELNEILDDLGLYNCTSYGNIDAMLAGAEGIQGAIATARAYRTNLIGIGSIPEGQRVSREGYQKFAADMNTVCKEINKEGCKLLYHHHSFEFFSLGGGETGMDILMGETDPDCVYFTLDTHWLAGGGVNPPDWIRRAKGRMPLIHFKDYAITGGEKIVENFTSAFAEVGEGNLNWPAIIEACRDAGVEFAVVEQDFCNGDPFDSLAISYRNMGKFGM